MSSNLDSCKSEPARCHCSDGIDVCRICSRTNLNDLAVPPNTCASPVLDTHSIHCGSNNTETVWSDLCTVPTQDVSTHTSTTGLAPNYLTTAAITSLLQPSVPDFSNTPAPIPIPPPTLSALDINRIPTPLSGRGDHKGHLFPYTKTPSPRIRRSTYSYSPSNNKTGSSFNDSQGSCTRRERSSTSPASPTPASAQSQFSVFIPDMHSDPLAIGRYPTSPLSSKPPSMGSGLTSQNPRRGNHGRQTSRNMQLNLGRYHPSNFNQVDSPVPVGPSATLAMQASQITYARAPPPVQMESPRLLREKHREFIKKAQQSSKLAASPFSPKPDAPRLDPLGSPHGAVTPLALEGEGGDYFTVAGSGKRSPAVSPSPRSSRAVSIPRDEDSKIKSRKLDA